MSKIDHELIAALYAGTLEEEPWLDFLQRLRQRWPAMLATLMLRYPTAKQRGFDVTDADWDIRALRQHYVSRHFDQPPVDEQTQQPGHIYRRQVLSQDDELASTALYQELLGPVGFAYILTIPLAEPGGFHGNLFLVRNQEQGDFTDLEVSEMQPLLRHLQQAFEIFARLKRAESEKSVLDETIDKLAVGTFLLDQSGQITSANATAVRLQEENPELFCKHQRLRLLDTEQDKQLQSLLAQLLANPVENRAHSLSVVRAGKLPLGFLLRPLSAASHYDSRHRLSAIIYVTDPSASGLIAPDVLSQLFGLTPTEARLAKLLTDGLSLVEAARALEVSEGTVRGYSKQIYAKTGVNRQADLVRLLLNSVAFLG